ncbi:uncharacterized protein SPSK_03350 [Sporothrix schenckii 1099-18]|uniref:Uncharacterized protein n=1 Tax=Sporothrix schenckii 1099-18 TaxID=1397361 RepID=A0A0F2M3D5_SPOSC|nr:uncharacterized protein SPSK_03350 [Sporothrix schenckii 1099-18]KJR82651.1 hypothetical protein SPSK_03350 [Sporothrix schenckii 1099-18]
MSTVSAAQKTVRNTTTKPISQLSRRWYSITSVAAIARSRTPISGGKSTAALLLGTPAAGSGSETIPNADSAACRGNRMPLRPNIAKLAATPRPMLLQVLGRTVDSMVACWVWPQWWFVDRAPATGGLINQQNPVIRRNRIPLSEVSYASEVQLAAMAQGYSKSLAHANIAQSKRTFIAYLLRIYSVSDQLLDNGTAKKGLLRHFILPHVVKYQIPPPSPIKLNFKHSRSLYNCTVPLFSLAHPPQSHVPQRKQVSDRSPKYCGAVWCRAVIAFALCTTGRTSLFTLSHPAKHGSWPSAPEPKQLLFDATPVGACICANAASQAVFNDALHPPFYGSDGIGIVSAGGKLPTEFGVKPNP